jgi:hypothetical protein
MPRARKPVPKFKSEAEERAFWEEHDTADYLDWSRAEVVQFPNLKLSTSTISPTASGSTSCRFEAPGEQTRCTLSVAAQGVPRGTNCSGKR